MKAIVLPAAPLRAARHCMAKSDIRYYLNGVRISSERISATNGHVLYDYRLTEHDKKQMNHGDLPLPEGDQVLTLVRDIPAKADSVVVLMFDNYAVLHYRRLVDGNTIFARDVAELVLNTNVDGKVNPLKYPDVDRVLPKGDPVPADRVGFNVAYLALAEKVFKCINRKWQSAALILHGENSPLHLEHTDPEGGKHVYCAMPMRL